MKEKLYVVVAKNNGQSFKIKVNFEGQLELSKIQSVNECFQVFTKESEALRFLTLVAENAKKLSKDIQGSLEFLLYEREIDFSKGNYSEYKVSNSMVEV